MSYYPNLDNLSFYCSFLYRSIPPQQAEQIFRQELKKIPDCHAYVYYLAKTLVRQNKWQEAVQLFEKIIQFNPFYKNTIPKLTQLYFQNNFFQKILKIIPDHPVFHYELANFYLNQKKLLLAKKHAENIVCNYPEIIVGHYILGLIAADQNKIEQAHKYFDIALKTEPEFNKALYAKTKLFINTNDWVDVLDCFQRILNSLGSSLDKSYFQKYFQIAKFLPDLKKILLLIKPLNLSFKNFDQINLVLNPNTYNLKKSQKFIEISPDIINSNTKQFTPEETLEVCNLVSQLLFRPDLQSILSKIKTTYEVHRTLGEIYQKFSLKIEQQQHFLNLAYQHYEQYHQFKPKYWPINYQMGIISLIKNDFQNAQQQFKKIKNFPDLFQNTLNLLSKKQLTKIIKQHEDLLEVSPELIELYYKIGLLYLQCANFKKGWQYLANYYWLKKNFKNEVTISSSKIFFILQHYNTVVLSGEKPIKILITREDLNPHWEAFLLRFIPDLKKKFPYAILSYNPSSSIKGWVKYAAIFDQLINDDHLTDVQTDLNIPLACLPHHLNLSVTGKSAILRYKKDVQKENLIHKKLLNFGLRKPLIGLFLHDETLTNLQDIYFKNIPLTTIAPYLKKINANIILLHKNDNDYFKTEAAILTELINQPVYDLNIFNFQLNEIITLIFLLDCYIGLLTPEISLCRNFIKNPYILLPYFNRVEFYQLYGNRGQFFKKQLKLYEQSADGDWEKIFQTLEKDLLRCNNNLSK